MRPHDKYKAITEGAVIATLQKPGDKPIVVDNKKGFPLEKITNIEQEKN